MGWIDSLATRIARRRLRLLRRNATDPGPIQDRLARRLANAARDTAFGREHGLGSVRTTEDLRRATPLRDYAGMAPYWQRALQGEPDVCWPGRIRHFALSSGTTAGEKYLPVSDATIRTNKGGGFDSLVPHLAAHHTPSTVFGGRMLFLGGCTELRETEHALIGDNTGIMARYMPRWLDRFYAPERSITAITDWERKIARAAEAAVDQDIRLIAGVPSWIILFAEAVLAEAARRGRSVESLRQLWPALQAFVHGGVAFAPYAHRVHTLFDSDPSAPRVRCIDTYSATEGGMLAVQDDSATPGMLPIVDRGAVFEFVPAEQLGSATPDRHTLAEVEPGIDYAVVLHTNAGIFGYLVGDLVKFRSTRPLALEFAGRIAHTVNGFGEHLSGGELDRAILHAARPLPGGVTEYAVAIRYPEPGRPTGGHVYFVETTETLSDSARSTFARELDRCLQSGNEDYATHRSHGVDAPTVRWLPPGTFLEFMRARGKVGGQHKVPRVLTAELAAELEATTVTC